MVPQGCRGRATTSRGVPGFVTGGKEGEHLCDRLTSEAMKLIEQRKPEQPFFLYLPFYDVHTPIMAKPELVKKYEAKAAKLGLPSVHERAHATPRTTAPTAARHRSCRNSR